MIKNYAVIAAGGLGTRLKDYKKNDYTKVLIDINGISMISLQVKQLKSWGFTNFIIITNFEFNEMIQNDVQSNFEDLHMVSQMLYPMQVVKYLQILWSLLYWEIIFLEKTHWKN